MATPNEDEEQIKIYHILNYNEDLSRHGLHTYINLLEKKIERLEEG